MGKILRVSLMRNFTPNTLGCYGLNYGHLSLKFTKLAKPISWELFLYRLVNHVARQ